MSTSSGGYVVAAKFKQNVDILMVLEEVFKLDDMFVSQCLVDNDLGL